MQAIWLKKPEEHDYPAAQDYLELVMPAQAAKAKVSLLKKSICNQKKSERYFQSK